MFVDASAIIAIIADEPGSTELGAKLGRAANAWTSPIAIFETVAALSRMRACSIPDALDIIGEFLRESGIETMEIGEAVGREALRAFERFGKGRHRAALNLGDCFAYGCAQQLNTPLLFKGDDFPLTDIELA